MGTRFSRSRRLSKICKKSNEMRETDEQYSNYIIAIELDRIQRQLDLLKEVTNKPDRNDQTS